jgi:hypothetical protein
MIVPGPDHNFYVHVRRTLADAGEPLDVIVEDVNRHIRGSGGLILADGQILHGPIPPEWILGSYFSEDTTTPYEHPEREWGHEQQAYFSKLWGLDTPYQYSREAAAYDRYCLVVRARHPFLNPSERALALIEAKRDETRYDCICHSGEVVYTSEHRLICMECGKLHCVLAAPLAHDFGKGFSEDQWHDLFDADGVLINDDVHIPTVDYQDVFAARRIWQTDIWEDRSSFIEFIARGDPEEVARWQAGNVGPEAFLEAGWSHAQTTPPLPADQLAPDNFGVDIAQNAARAFNLAADAFGRSRTDGDALRDAVLNLFHAIELILKMRLQMIHGTSSPIRLNNPQVLEALVEAGVRLNENERMTITTLRQIRNLLQHDAVRYGYREARGLLVRAFTLLDSFISAELGGWIGDIAEQPGWDALLAVEAIRVRAEREAEQRVAQATSDPTWRAEPCPTCRRTTVVREGGNAGFCLYCRRIPVVGGRPPPSSTAGRGLA